MKAKTFAAVLLAATELDPFGKKLSDGTINMAFLTLPESVKEKVTDEMLVFALQQLQLDPVTKNDLTIIQQLFAHVFKVENGAPNYSWGLKNDLAQRMAIPNRFHGQLPSPYELGEDLGRRPEPRFAPEGVLHVLEGGAA